MAVYLSVIRVEGNEVQLLGAWASRGAPALVEALEAVAEHDTPEQREEALRATVESLLGQMKTRPLAFVLCLPAHRVVTRLIRVPFKGRSQVAQAVPVELEPHLPFPVDELALDFTVVRPLEDETEVLAFGMRQNALDERMAPLVELEASPEAAIPDTAGLTALWLAVHRRTRDAAVVVHLCQESCVFTFLKDRKICFTRAIPMTGADAVASPEAFARELRNTMRSLALARKGDPEPDRIYLTGLPDGHPVAAELERTLGLPVTTEMMIRSVRGVRRLAADREDALWFNRWEPLVGAAIAASGGDAAINLIRGAQAGRMIIPSVISHALFSACLGLVAVMLWGLSYHVALQRLELERSLLDSQAEKVSEEILRLADEGLGEDVTTVPFFDPPLLDVLNDLSGRIPPKSATVMEIRLAPPGTPGAWISVTGETGDASQFNHIMEQLQGATLYKVSPDASVKMQGERTIFRVRLFRPNQEISSNEQS